MNNLRSKYPFFFIPVLFEGLGNEMELVVVP
jgi:hypothetical protein